MAQIVSRGRPGPVVTVAELMRRCAPAPEPADDDGADPIPVGALLRREGRSSAGLPAEQAPAVGDILAALPARHPLLRRGAIAAGALLAAGSVFGLTSAMNAPVAPPSSTGTYPGQDESAAAPASAAALDAGQAAPTSWLPLAFPTAFPDAAANQAAAPRAAAPAPPAPTTAARPAAGGGSSARPSSSPATSARSSSGSSKTNGGIVEKTTKDVGGTVRDVGKDTPLEGVTDTVGDTVTGLGRRVDAVAAPITTPITTPLKSALTAPPTSSRETATSTPSTSTRPTSTSAPTSAVKSAANTVTGLVGG